jgi:hypothetical protein
VPLGIRWAVERVIQMSDPPSNPPEPTRALMRVGGPIDSCSATLRLYGDDLDPDVVTALLGASSTTACRKGDVTRLKVTTRTERSGKWLLTIEHQAGVTLEEVINALLDRVTGDLAVWGDLTKQFKVDLFCGLQMKEWNRGLSISAETLKRVGERGLELGLDIYYIGE